METTEHLDLQAETLSGDVRDFLLTHLRSMETPWSKLSEAQQQDKIFAAESAGRDVARKAVSLVANRGFTHMPITLKDWTVKDGIQLKVTAADTVEEITKLAEHRGSALLVFASTSAFLGERTAAEADKDQPELPMHDGDGVVLTVEQQEEMLNGAVTLKGLSVRLEGFPEERHAEMEALVASKGGKVVWKYPATSETIQREREKTAGRNKRHISATEAA